jgi:hypothetical protein
MSDAGTTNNTVNHPTHYNQGKLEVIDVIEDWKLGFCEGNAVKYIARAKHKGKELEDLQKARWYLDRAIQALEAPLSRTIDDVARKHLGKEGA